MSDKNPTGSRYCATYSLITDGYTKGMNSAISNELDLAVFFPNHVPMDDYDMSLVPMEKSTVGMGYPQMKNRYQQ